ncbi:single-stranded-DNA-specific exonuclease RecJ [Microcoleus sp. FACHB-672]|uniref:single-stranded-DNA-specific exonuclease RecJ n=1 Tax=Microcoleus sp. FACHB-672 TaxID=2692825 RepID=UPI0016896BB6|nr:single-stranded-DNA-specific exonuclease RecJ [Microcoleus sp. FACHB-672]MBD2042578.1 single-stranded-DNA-specific exonuclease RecJ [Microcoleus sp. FACHB-672]
MPEQTQQWQVQPPAQPPAWLLQEIRRHVPESAGHYAAQLLWQRGIRDPKQLAGFLNPQAFQPASPFEFGQEMHSAVERLQQARNNGEKVTIWGDFDADGVTSTAVLWDGLGQFFTQNDRLTYYIPNRLTESHGLNIQGINTLAESRTQLIVTCDTGSTNLAEIEYANQLGIDVIVTDHHTLPADRPPVVAIINPRYLPVGHQMEHLSGVAVAYKLVEALYLTLPAVPQQPLENLLDLVAIGLIADLVQLSGECRYLAKQGIQRLQKQLTERTRPGVAKLLELCKRSGDRPTDISFGIGPRINAVSRIHGDASFCVELLTSQNQQRCEHLAMETELANTRRQSLQKEVTQQVKLRLEQMDLSTTSVIVLVDEQWAAGVLGLVAGQVAQEYGRPTVLLSSVGMEAEGEEESANSRNLGSALHLARGSARSVNQIDLYQLVKAQAHLLHRFGGHPFAAGLSLPVGNIPLFIEAINRQLREQIATLGVPVLQADLVVSVADLGQPLFRELKLLEPCGMGNPAPKLLIQNCWFEKTWHRNNQDLKGRKVQYIKTEFEIWDNSTNVGFPGLWWGHYKEEVPQGRCNAIVELDYNTYKNRYEVRLLAVQSCEASTIQDTGGMSLQILDWRDASISQITSSEYKTEVLPISQCPTSWDELQVWFRQAMYRQQSNQGELPALALAYPPPQTLSPLQIWQQLVGVAKYLSRTDLLVSRRQLCEKLSLSDYTLHLGLETLAKVNFEVIYLAQNLRISQHTQAFAAVADAKVSGAIEQFLAAVQEEQFRRQYFYEVPVSTVQAIANSIADDPLDSHT